MKRGKLLLTIPGILMLALAGLGHALTSHDQLLCRGFTITIMLSVVSGFVLVGTSLGWLQIRR